MPAKVRIGTSGFSYKEWKPAFYPADVPQARFLEYYASQLSAVEIDATFYRMPNQKTLEGWRERTPESFRFALKASRRITHWERLRVESEALDYLMEVLPVLGSRLGTVLYQLPPNFRADSGRLELFLARLPDSVPAAFEFRHESWFSDETFALLEQYRRALVIQDADDQTTPVRRTSGTVYVRLRKSSYPEAELEAWRARFREWCGDGVDVYAFVKHQDNPDAPRIAQALAAGV